MGKRAKKGKDKRYIATYERLAAAVEPWTQPGCTCSACSSDDMRCLEIESFCMDFVHESKQRIWHCAVRAGLCCACGDSAVLVCATGVCCAVLVVTLLCCVVLCLSVLVCGVLCLW